jgi:hypothetical protein
MKLTEMHAALLWSGPSINQCLVSSFRLATVASTNLRRTVLADV